MSIVEKLEEDPNGLCPHSVGAKLDKGKIRPYLVYKGFINALQEVWANGTFGAEKYTDNGWKGVSNGHDRYLEAAYRHLDKYHLGEERDQESGTHHLGAAVWNLLASLQLALEDKSK